MTPADSVRLEMQNFGFTTVLMSLAAESCRSRAESVHLLKPYLQWGKGLKEFQLSHPLNWPMVFLWRVLFFVYCMGQRQHGTQDVILHAPR